MWRCTAVLNAVVSSKMTAAMFVSGRLIVISCLLCTLLIPSYGDVDPGFDLLFTSRIEEHENLPIHFSPPHPTWLEGSLIRNVAGRFEFGNRKFTHCFDAFAKLYSWNFYRNRSELTTKFIRSHVYNDSLAEQTIATYMIVGSVIPGYDIFQKLEQLLQGNDNVNVNVNCIRGENGTKAYVALTDSWRMYAFDPKSLRTIERIDAKVSGKSVPMSQMMSAHILPEKGTTNFFTVLSVISHLPFLHSHLLVVRVKSSQEREVLVDIPVKLVPYIHSFGVTEHFVIIFAAPFYFSTEKLLETGIVIESLVYDPYRDTDIYIINIETKEITELTTPNFFFMHHVNAFEQGKDRLIVDICAYKDPNVLKNFTVDVMKNMTERNKIDYSQQLKRYAISLTSKTVTPSIFPDTKGAEFANLFDMPAINENYRFAPYCFVYGLASKIDKKTASKSAVIKKNVCKSGDDKFWYQENHYLFEPWFVGRPNATDEDDGVLLVQALDGPRGQAYLAIIDAKQMKMISKAYVPFAIPMTLHGRFFSSMPGI